MAARTPRTTTAGKTAAKKARPATAPEKIAAFDELRAIAGDYELIAAVTEPYELGQEWGFDPPVIARFPADLENKVLLDMASRRADAIGILSVLLGDVGLLRVVQAFKTQPDGDRLLIGLQMRLTNHFLGRGAAQVGGTAAS
ncbi:hypothetical protein IU459_27010 [Nocardia amamiensis]|uniref:Uncharacterized protein n=1 Tax=Nocardia amamiensis TaxID=404578 RepID=A0ABS0CXT4_9NOCA|nr:hypothetical protein [Nocardia amamiensis]MBF6301166.1 hypothetical protein [Nocardia amamiensis]